MKCNGKIAQLLVMLLVILLSNTPAAAQYAWNGFQLNGDAGNPAWAYNGTVASGTVNNGNQHFK